MIELLLLGSRAGTVQDRLAGQQGRLHAPHILELEVAQVLRRYYLRGELTPERGAAALDQLVRFGIRLYPHTALLPELWRLRDNVTAFDAAYLVLAEVLDAPLITTDARLATAPGHRATVEVIGD